MSNSILEANKLSFGTRVLPMYRFDKAKFIVSFGADFIGGWGQNNRHYIKGKIKKQNNVKHYQIESTLTLTGSNACERLQIKPSEQKGLLSNLYEYIVGGKVNKRIEKLAKNLKDNIGIQLLYLTVMISKLKLLLML